MDSYGFLFDVALILISTKIFGLITRRFDMPQVVGALLAGLILGPAMLGILHETEFMDQIAEIGVIVLMFTAGLETDIDELKHSGKASFVIALCGVLLPLAGGFLVSYLFNHDTPEAFLQNIFIGVILTATSVSISVETLKEMGKLSTRSGNAILGAALIDDILGIIALTMITSFADEGVSIAIVLLKIALFFVLSLIVGVFLHKWLNIWMSHYADKRRFVIAAFAFCLLYAYVAEHFFGVADITGAFIAGLVIANTSKTTFIASRFEIPSYMLFSPVFFASIGAKVVLPSMNTSIILFSLLLLLVAILSKVLGCGLGAKLCAYSNNECLQIGVGMISRGEVALIVATKGIASGLMVESFFGPVVIMVVATTIVTPVFLRLVYRDKKDDYSDLVESNLVEQYEEVEQFDLASQALLEKNDRLRKRFDSSSKEEK